MNDLVIKTLTKLGKNDINIHIFLGNKGEHLRDIK
jgi:hypothetical protein